jgi:hypothetical protein
MNHLAMSFPVWRKMAVGVSVMPYSNVGYKITQKETKTETVAGAGDITYTNQGEGGLTQVMLGVGYSFGKLSVGGQAQYIFGAIDRYDNVTFSDATIANTNSGKLIKANNFTFGLGAQYELPVGKYHLTAGVTYQFQNNMKAEKTDFAYSVGSMGTDTVRYDNNADARLLVPAALGVGFTFRKNDQWLVGLDYTFRDWSTAVFDTPSNFAFKTVSEHILRAGFESTPNRYDIRYFLKRWTYRAGLFFENTYMQFNGNRIQNYGATVGLGLPIGSRNNAVNIAIEAGQRGTTANNLVREMYWKVSVSVSLYDLWFIKQRFE